jgi:hypothetical protein
MNKLCKASRSVWQDFEKAFENLLVNKYRTLEYKYQFNEEFMEALLNLEKKHGRIDYKLSIKLIETNSYLKFLDFLSKAHSSLKFKRIC